MSAPETRQGSAPRSRAVDLALAVGVLAALFAATLPLLRVVDSGPWVPGAFALTAVVLGVGYAVRWFRLPGLVVSLAEIVTWVALVTAVFGRGTALLWIIPTADTISLVGVLLPSAFEDVALGAAPLEAGPALTFLIVASIGLLAIALDHVVLTARMPLLAAVGLIAVSLIPSIAVPGDIDLAAFIALAASILFLLGVDTRARQRAATALADPGDPILPAARVPSGTAIGIGAIAIVVAMVASPLLPAPIAIAGGVGSGGGGSTIDPSLELGDDLRQPGAVEVLQLSTSGSSAPYLRVATLSEFDGDVWEPDEGDKAPLQDSGPDIETIAVDEGIELEERRATIDIVNLNSRWAPVPYPVDDISSLDGEWSIAVGNRTVDAESGSVQGQQYEVVAAVADPTLEQIRARPSGGVADDDVYALPGGIPDIIEETAEEVTADARSDYDALVDLQAWFRGSDFSYSLEAPVSDGFDGTGVDAIADFLEVREGYCVHFAAAFAVMARTLGMPARIVVGYLPGTSTGSPTDGETVYSVQSTQLHAWPEVHFEGIGWVPFEPTNSLGTPTGFSSGTTTAPGSVPSSAPRPETAIPTPTPSASAGGPLPGDRDPGATAQGGSAASADPWPFAAAAVAILVLVSPGTVRAVRRRRLWAAAGRGDAASAWLSVQELAIDLGIPVPASESPRAFGARLVAQRGADPAAVEVLVAAIERASYARDSTPESNGVLADAVTTVSASLLETVPAARRAAARFLPRSLAIRPGSAFAGLRPPPVRETTA